MLDEETRNKLEEIARTTQLNAAARCWRCVRWKAAGRIFAIVNKRP